MLRLTKLPARELDRKQASDEEALEQAKGWDKYHKDTMPTKGTSGCFDQYAQQLFVQVPKNQESLTAVTIPKLSDRQDKIPPTLIQNAISDSELWQEQFCCRNGTLLMPNAKGEVVPVANFTLAIEGYLQEIESRGIKNEYKLKITTRNRSFTCIVEKKDLYKLSRLLVAEHPDCYVFPGREEDFKTYIWLQVEEFTRHGEPVPYKIYNQLGWVNIDGTWRFLHAGLKNLDFEVRGNLTLRPDLRNSVTFYSSFCLTAPPRVTLMLLLYAVYAYMAGLYQKWCADEGCRSVMYLAGRTGSGKTSLVKILTTWLKDAGLSIELRFDDTLASLQENLVSNRDIVTLVDDFYPKATKAAKAEFQRKAEEITRIIGDGRVKGKMGVDRKLMPDRDYCGGIIATGEYVDLGTHSSYLRCFILNLSKGDVKFDRLAILQQSPELAQAFFSTWIDWLEKNQMVLRNKLPAWQRANVNTVNSAFLNEYARLTVSIAALMTTADCFSEFAKAIGIEFEVNAAKKIVLEQAQHMYETVKVVAPEQVAMEAIIEAIESGDLDILESKEAFRKNPKADGYCEDGDKYWVVTTKVREVVKRYAESNNYSVEFTPMLREALFEKGFMVSKEEKKFSLAIPGKPSRPRGYTFIIREEDKNDQY